MKYAALLRGVNVGGKNRLPMKDLAAMFEEAGCGAVATYIQSDNVVFSAPARVATALPGRIQASIAARFGHRVPLVIRSAAELQAIAANNPFLQAGEPEPTLHVVFLADLPTPEAIGTLDPLRSAPDAFRVVGREIFLHMPNGMGRSKLTSAYFDTRLSTMGTARNWATLRKLVELTRD